MEIEEVPRATLADIARHTGLSKATVCRAINRTSNVSPAAQQKVEDAVKELHYRSDPALRALAQHRWKHRAGMRLDKFSVVLLEISQRAAGANKSPDRRDMVEAVRARCEQMDIRLEVFHRNDFSSFSEMGRVIYHRGVDGIIASLAVPMTDWKFPWEHFAVATVGYDHPEHRHHSIVSDWAQAVALAREKARESGAKRIGYLFFPHRHPGMDGQIRGSMLHQMAKDEAEGREAVPLFTYENPDIMANQAAFNRWLKMHRPDAIVDGNIVAHWWLRDMGFGFPRDIGYSSLLRPDPQGLFPGVLHRYDAQGELALEKVINLLQLNRRGQSDFPLRSLVPCGWKEAVPTASAAVKEAIDLEPEKSGVRQKTGRKKGSKPSK